MFNRKVNAEPIDRDSMGQGRECVVVFPIFLVKKKVEGEPLTKRLVLGIRRNQP